MEAEPERQVVSGAGDMYTDDILEEEGQHTKTKEEYQKQIGYDKVGNGPLTDLKKTRKNRTRIPLVETKFEKIRNTILEKEEFKDVGYNPSKSWEIRPAIVHF